MSLLKLPRETRDQIYAELVPQNIRLLYKSNEPIKTPTTAISNLAQVCRQLYGEIRGKVESRSYKEAFIRFIAPNQFWQSPTFEDYLTEIESLDPRKCRYITHAIFQDRVEIVQTEVTDRGLVLNGATSGLFVLNDVMVCPIETGGICRTCSGLSRGWCEGQVTCDMQGQWELRWIWSCYVERMDFTGIRDVLVKIDRLNKGRPWDKRGLGKDGVRLLVKAYRSGRENFWNQEKVRRVDMGSGSPKDIPSAHARTDAEPENA